MPTTIAVAGLPLDATYRELKNFCRLCPGFEAASPNIRAGRSPILFVKFYAQAAASEAIMRLSQMCFDQDRDPTAMLKAEFARNEMSVNLGQQNGHNGSDDAGGLGSIIVPPVKRARSEVTQGEVSSHGVDTLACKLDHAGQGQKFFEPLPGFLVSKIHPNRSNFFVKFTSHYCAQKALNHARSAGLIADFAKRNLEEGDIVPTPPPPTVPMASVPGSVSTLACKQEHGRETYQAFFCDLPGFETLRFPQAGGNCFVKFISPASAEQALIMARQSGFTIDFAKRDAGDPDPQVQPIVPQLPTPPSTQGGVCTLACKLEGYHDLDSTQDFFISLNGFEAVRVAASGGNCFFKYENHYHAQSALDKALQAGYIVDFARRELGDEGRAHQSASPEGGNTLACKMEDHTEESIEAYFLNLYGYEKLRVNAAGTNCFLKFVDYACAQAALELARVDGFTLDFARRNLERCPWEDRWKVSCEHIVKEVMWR